MNYQKSHMMFSQVLKILIIQAKIKYLLRSQEYS